MLFIYFINTAPEIHAVSACVYVNCGNYILLLSLPILIKDPVVNDIANKYKKTVGQVSLSTWPCSTNYAVNVVAISINILMMFYCN